MSEEVRILKEIVDNSDLDNYTIDDDECYLNGYARKCLKKVLDQLQQKENIIKEAINYIKEESWFCYKDNEEVIDRTSVEKLLEILDKVEENK